MAKKVALVTLTKALSQTVGRHRFEQNKTVRVTDPQLIEALQADGAFAVKIVEETDDKAKAAKPAGKASGGTGGKEPEATSESDEKPVKASGSTRGGGK